MTKRPNTPVVTTAPRADDVALQAAAKLFRVKGFAGTTVREIAAEAGMLPGSLHYRYPTKEALLLALMARAVAQVGAAVEAATADVTDAVERLRAGLRAHLEHLLSGDDAVYVLVFEWCALSGDALAEMTRLRDRYEAIWGRLLGQAAAAGALRADLDLGVVRRLGFGAVNWIATWYRPGGPHTPETLADQALELLLHGAAPPREGVDDGQSVR